MTEASARRHVVLVGLPGVGKSTVGRLLAERLAAPFIDVDQLLVRQMGRPVSQIFGMVGETGFRQMEREAVRAAMQGQPAVIVPGGGWAAQPGEIEAAAAKSLILYLKCLPGTAIKRSAGGEARPLLAGANPLPRMLELLQAREPFYTKAHAELNAETRPVEAIAEEAAAWARRHGGW